MAVKILLTGKPGCGKTTLLRKVLSALVCPAGGFFTLEIRESGVRKGFEVVTLEGKHGLLAHVDSPSRQRIGRYGVDLAALEMLAVPAIRHAVECQALVVIDEIGPMEFYSELFCQTVLEALQSDAAVLGTIVKRKAAVADKIKRLPGITLLEVTPSSREALAGEAIRALSVF